LSVRTIVARRSVSVLVFACFSPVGSARARENLGRENMARNEELDKGPLNSWRDFCYVVFSHKKKVLAFFVLVAGGIGAFTFFSPEVYRSEAKLLVRPGRENIGVDPSVRTSDWVGVTRSWENEINSELEILTSEDLIERVVTELGPAKFVSGADSEDDGGSPATEAEGGADGSPPRQRKSAAGGLADVKREVGKVLDGLGIRKNLSVHDRAVLEFRKRLRVEALRKTNVIYLSFEAESPALAQEALSRLVALYRERRKVVYRPTGAYEFFKQQMEQLREKIRETQKALRDLKDRYGIASMADWRRVLTERIGNLERDSQATTAALAAAQAKVEALREALKKLPEKIETARTTSRPTYGADLMREHLFELKVKELEMVAKYGAGTPPVKVIREQVSEAEKLLKQSSDYKEDVSVGINTTRQQVEQLLVVERAQVAALQVQSEALRTFLAQTKQDVSALNETEMELAAVERELAIQEANYRKYADNTEQARIDRAMQTEKISSISIVQPATRPLKPLRPNRPLNLVLGLAAGIFASIAVALLAEFVNHSLSRPEDVERRLGLSSVVSVPRLSRRVLRPVVSSSRGGPAGTKNDAAKWETNERSREYFEAVKNRVVLSLNGRTPHGIIGVVSCFSGEGASIVAANLAVRLSRSEGGRVLLMHANGRSRRQKLARLFHVRGTLEEGEVSVDSENKRVVLRPTRVGDRLDLLLGLSPGFGPKAVKRILGGLRERYTFVVVDLPPVLGDSSALRWASVMDGVILVLEAERVRWEAAVRGKRLLEEAGTRILGAVLNKRRYPIPGWLYKAV